MTKAAADARKSAKRAPITKGDTFPHRVTVKGKGGAVVMLRPASPHGGHRRRRAERFGARGVQELLREATW